MTARRTPLERLEASNLGQIVGRLLCGQATSGATAEVPRALSTSGSGATAQVRRALEGVGEPLTVSQIVARCADLTTTKVSTALHFMRDVDRSGSRGSYRYKLKAPPPP